MWGLKGHHEKRSGDRVPKDIYIINSEEKKC
jgi:hypothetical protein